MNMEVCPKCLVAVPNHGALTGLCASCLWMGFETDELALPSAETLSADHQPSSDTQVPSLQAGQRVDGYLIQQLLGAGGLSEVYRVVDGQARPFALKLSKQLARRATWQLEQQQNELSVLRQLSHPCLVSGRDGGVLPDGRMYIVMDLVEGLSLRELLRQREPLDAMEAVWIATQVAEALAHCHERGILHLDLKPQNIMVTDRHALRVRVVDFGLTRALSGASHEAPLMWAGTPGYAAPEYLRGESQGMLDSRADLYSLGVVLFELLTGELPIAANRTAELLRAQAQGSQPRLAHALRGPLAALAPLLSSLLEPDPDRRYASARSLARELMLLFCQLLAPQPTPHAGRASRPDCALPAVTPLLGRDAELTQLEQQFRRAEAGKRCRCWAARCLPRGASPKPSTPCCAVCSWPSSWV